MKRRPTGPAAHSAIALQANSGPVVRAQDRRERSSLDGQAVGFGDEVFAGDVAVDHPAEAFAGVVVDDRHDLDRRPSVVTSNWKLSRWLAGDFVIVYSSLMSPNQSELLDFGPSLRESCTANVIDNQRYSALIRAITFCQLQIIRQRTGFVCNRRLRNTRSPCKRGRLICTAFG